MASSCSRFVSRAALSSLRSSVKPNPRSAPTLSGSATAAAFSPKAAPAAGKFSSPASPLRRFSSLSRLPSELGCAQSLLPLHSAVAGARLTSCLSLTSRSCRALSQGT